MNKSSYKVAVLTGAAGGIGSEIAKMLDNQGYHTVLVDLNLERLEQLSRKLVNTPMCIASDITDSEKVDQIRNQVIQAYGKIDVLINNAGVINTKPTELSSYEEIDLEINVNYKAAVYMTKAFLPYMIAQKTGHIISISSLGGLMPLKETPGYSGSKFALRGYMLSLYLAVKKHGIHVSTLYPTAIDTPMLLKESITGGSPLNFFSAPLSPEDVASAVQKAIQKKKIEISLPGAAGVFCKIMSTFPKQIPLMTEMIKPLSDINLKTYVEKNKVILENMKSELGL